MARDIQWWLRESAVRVGNVWVPGRQVEPTLARYTKQLFCLTHYNEYPYAFLGSASGVRAGDRCFMVWCRHRARALHCLEMTRTTEFAADGLSGGAVYHLARDNRGYFVGLAGTIVRGSNSSSY